MLGHPMTKPPTMLMNRIRMPAIASPRTNLEAPSIEPKNSRLVADLQPAALGLLQSIRPAPRSASIAICFAGHGISVKRAPTSAMRWRPGDDDEVDHHQDREHDQADREAAADQKCPKASMTAPAAPGPLWPSIQHDSGSRPRSATATAAPPAAAPRERPRSPAAAPWGCHHHHHQRGGDVEGEQQVQQQRRQRQTTIISTMMMSSGAASPPGMSRASAPRTGA